MKTRRLPPGTLALPGVESPDDFCLRLQKVRANALPMPPPPALAWPKDWRPLPSEETAQDELDRDTCLYQDDDESHSFYTEFIAQ